MSETISIDGFGPLPVHHPAAAAEVGRLVREAAAAGKGLYPVGGRTTLDLGLPPTKPGLAVDLTGLDQVIDYPARDMTITVQTGITLAKLQETLAAENQWLPVDVAEKSTIGGAIAANASGPRRYGHGTLRDYVIGISFVTDDGTEVKGGGRVVKNVAGYDLMKLHTGALGTLGIITQVTLKVKPKPEDATAVVFGCKTAEVGPLLDVLHASKSRPAAVELLNASAWRAAGFSPPILACDWIIAIGLEEKRSTVAWQLSTLLSELNGMAAADATELRGADASRLWSALTALQTRPESRFIWKANVLPSRTAEFIAGEVVGDTLVHAHGLNGIVWLHAPVDRKPESAAAFGGALVTRRAPTEWKTPGRVWAAHPRGNLELMRQVKQTLDPNNVFNPGRLFP